MGAITSYDLLTNVEDNDNVLGTDADVTTNRIPISAIRGTGVNHNSYYFEKDITTMFDNGTFSTNIKDGNFKDIYPGNYITKKVTIDSTEYTVIIKIVDIDYYYGGYSSSAIVNTHHVACLVLGLPNASMNAANTTAGGYKGSVMNTTTLPTYLTALEAALGSSHFVSHSSLMTNDIGTSLVNKTGAAAGASSSWEWVSEVKIILPGEIQIYGSQIWGSSGYDVGEARKQFAACKNVNINKIVGSRWFWLKDVVSSSSFALVNSVGRAYHSGASAANGVIPLILLS